MMHPSGRHPGPMSSIEREVSDALELLQPRFVITFAGKRLQYSGQGGHRFSYEPDFEVKDADGKSLFIEVKMQDSLSLPNLVRFIEINSRIREDNNCAFLILVWGKAESAPRALSKPEFSELAIRYVSNSDDVRKAVVEEFNRHFSKISKD